MFDAKTEIARLQAKKGIRSYPSKLDRFGFEIRQLRAEHVSYQLIQQSLFDRHKLSVEVSTIYRWLKKHG